MLLGLMRKHAKSFIIKIMIAVIAISFVLYFGYKFTDQEKTKIATVNGEIIGKLEFNNARKIRREMLQRQFAQYGQTLTDKMLKEMNFDQGILDNLIRERLVEQGAHKLGLDVTPAELKNHIQSFPAFQDKGFFDENRYAALLRDRNMQPADFEKDQSQLLLEQKTRQFLAAFAPVSRQEIADQYEFMNRKVKIRYIHIPAGAFEKTVIVDPKALETYFGKNRESYRVPDKIRVSYMIVDPAAYSDKIQVQEKDIEDYYEDNLGKFEEKKQVKARHILFGVDLEAAPAEVEKIREKAQGVLKRVQAGEDFGKLAREFSQDPATAANGGLLDYFKEQEMMRPFALEAFKLKKGEISRNLVRTESGFHIIKAEGIREAKTRTLADARPEIMRKLSAEAQSEYAYNQALELMDKLPYEVDLKQYAAQNNLSSGESGFFKQSENIPDLAASPKISEALFDLAKGDFSEIIEIQDKFYVFQVVERRPSYLPELKEVQEKVRKAFIDSLVKAEARKEAEKCLAQLKKGEAWEAIAKDGRFLNAATGFFRRNDALPELADVPELKETAFELNETRKYPDKVFQNEKGAYLIKWEASEGVDRAKYAAEALQYRANLQNSKRGNLIADWENFLKTSAKIEMEDDEEKAVVPEEE